MIFKLKLLFLYLLFKIQHPDIKIGRNINFNSKILCKVSRTSFVEIGNNCTFSNFTKHNFAGINRRCSIRVKDNSTLKIGDNCGFSGTIINVKKAVKIGDNVQFGVNVNIWDNDFHSIDYLKRRKNIGIISDDIVISNDVWVGANTTILKGVSIGKCSIIASNSLVNKSIGDYELWGGIPAQKLKDLERS
jgi:acetyltransferase-like isoleucine patch superfamily enzyme